MVRCPSPQHLHPGHRRPGSLNLTASAGNQLAAAQRSEARTGRPAPTNIWPLEGLAAPQPPTARLPESHPLSGPRSCPLGRRVERPEGHGGGWDTPGTCMLSKVLWPKQRDTSTETRVSPGTAPASPAPPPSTSRSQHSQAACRPPAGDAQRDPPGGQGREGHRDDMGRPGSASGTGSKAATPTARRRCGLRCSGPVWVSG